MLFYMEILSLVLISAAWWCVGAANPDMATQQSRGCHDAATLQHLERRRSLPGRRPSSSKCLRMLPLEVSFPLDEVEDVIIRPVVVICHPRRSAACCG